MIDSAAEFVRLRRSEDRAEYDRAAREEAPDSVWLDVMRDFPSMKEWVAYNKTVPLGILRVLAMDPDPSVRASVASKRKLTPDLFEMLAADPAEQVRLRIAYNPKAPPGILAQLRQDEADVVRAAAASRG
ncbi:hypothetical protein GCM10008944_21830 [Cytobacillus oceanisediminis]